MWSYKYETESNCKHYWQLRFSQVRKINKVVNRLDEVPFQFHIIICDFQFQSLFLGPFSLQCHNSDFIPDISYIYICNCLYSIFKLSIFSPAIQIFQYWMWKVAQSLTSNRATAEQRLEEQKGRFRSNLLEKFNVKTSSHRFISKQVN